MPLIAFGDFTFDPATGELWRNGAAVPLQPQPSRLLALLVARPGEVVTRDEIRQALWSDTHVDFERSLNFCVARVRAALGDNAGEPRFIETVPTRGYRFIVASTRATPNSASPPAARRVAIRRAGFASLAAAAVLGSVLVWQRVPLRGQPPRVVVVPFHNETGSADLDRVAKGVSDATVVKLAASERVQVIGNASNATFTFRPPDLKAMGDALGAQYLVLGQMKRDDRRMRIVAHLIRVSDQTHVWANTYDTEVLDLPQQSNIAAEIASAVTARLPKGA